MSLSVVMPCYNEKPVIRNVIHSFYHEINKCTGQFEIIVVDDGGTDGSTELLEKMAAAYPELRVIKRESNGGHGRAVRAGYDAAVMDYVFQVDTDNQFRAEDLQNLYMRREHNDLILGFRKKRRDPLSRRFLSRVIRLFNGLRFGVWLRDANCPFRIYKREALTRLLRKVDPEACAPNILLSVLAARAGMKIVEVPVEHLPRKTGKVWGMDRKLIAFTWKSFRQLAALRPGETG